MWACPHQQGGCDWSFNDPPYAHIVRVVPASAVKEKSMSRMASCMEQNRVLKLPSVVVEESGQNPKNQNH